MTNLVPSTATLRKLTVLGCVLPGLAACDVDRLTNKTTTRRTTVNIEYQDGVLSPEEAQDRARERCGDSEVLSVSQPMPEPSGRFKVSAECLSTYDHNGTLIPNET